MRRWVSIAVLLCVVGIAPAYAKRRPPPPPPADTKGVGYLVVFSTPFARIHVDGKDTGRMTPIPSRARLELAPGKHKLTFVVGGEIFHYSITIRAGETLKITKQLPVTKP